MAGATHISSEEVVSREFVHMSAIFIIIKSKLVLLQQLLYSPISIFGLQLPFP